MSLGVLRFYVDIIAFALTGEEQEIISGHLIAQAAQFLNCQPEAIAAQWIAFERGENCIDLTVEFSYPTVPFGVDRGPAEVDRFSDVQLRWLQTRAPLPDNIHTVAFHAIPLAGAQFLAADRVKLRLR